jgi:flagellar motor protein MotB
LVQRPDTRAVIVGHTDNLPTESLYFEDNYDLSAARARAVMMELVQKHGIDADRLSPVGCGSDQPVDPRKTPEALRKNRRIEVKILPGWNVTPEVAGVEPGEVELRLNLLHSGDLPLREFEIDEILPPDMKYVSGSSLVSGAQSAEPDIQESAGGTTLRWRLPAENRNPGGMAVTYRARVLSIDPSQPLTREARLRWWTAEGDSGTSGPLRTSIYASEMPPHTALYTLGPADFAKDGVRLSAGGKEALKLVSEFIKGFDRVRIVIEGHTDRQQGAVPGFRNTRELSAAQGRSVKEVLQRLTGLADDVFTVRGYGSTRPVDNNFTPDGRQRNRRVEITLRGWREPVPQWMQETKLSPEAASSTSIEVPIVGFRTSAATSAMPEPTPRAGADAATMAAFRGEGRVGLSGVAFAGVEAQAPAAGVDSGAHGGSGDGQTDTDAQVASSGQAETGILTLPLGGRVWMVEDPGVDEPRLEVSGPDLLRVEAGRVVGAARFAVSTNYAAFIRTWQLLLFRGTDTDLTRPVRTLSGQGLQPRQLIDWDGTFDTAAEVAADDDLLYVLRVYDDQSHLDETSPGRIQIVHSSDDRDRATAATPDTLQMRNLPAQLRVQGIPVRGGRVRIHGDGIPAGTRVRVADQEVELAHEGRFDLDWLLPTGGHDLPISARNAGGTEFDRTLRVDVKDTGFFMVGIADVALGDSRVSGNPTLTASDPELNGDWFGTGRLAFYLKGLWRGKYRATAQLDTHLEELGDILGNLDHKDPRALFRRLDPDLVSLTYGDRSTTFADVNTQGRLFARVDWDKSQALWGNYATGFTGTEFAQYDRSLYGAYLRHRSLQATSQGEQRVDGTAFASAAQTAFGHNEFLGTGGSLYYLAHTDVVQGSEKIWVEVRDRDSDRVLENVTLVRYRDYEIDELQGRIVLHRPLVQVTDPSVPSIIKDTPLDGDRVLLLVDYEYIPAHFDPDKVTAGVRGRVWATDDVAVGGTLVRENRDDQDYELAATDVVLRAGRGTYLKTEYAQSHADQSAANFYSADGGVTFENRNFTGPSSASAGDAVGFEAKVDLAEFLRRNDAPQVSGWWKQRDAGFSTARLNTRQETEVYGAEFLWRTRTRFTFGSRWSVTNTGDAREDRSTSVEADYRFARWQLGGEVRHRSQETGAADSSGATLGGVRLGVDLRPGVHLYSLGQVTLHRDDRVERNNLGTFGLRSQWGPKFNLRAETSTGNRGTATRFGTDVRLDPSHELFGTYTLSTDHVDGTRGILSLGQRKTISNQLRVFTDHQFTHGEHQTGSTQACGLTYVPRNDWSLSASYQKGDIADATVGSIDRNAVSMELTVQKLRRRLSLKGELRDDGGAVDRRQWLTNNRFDLDLAQSWTVLGKLSWSRTDDRTAQAADAQFVESGIGLAYRPVRHNRVNFLGRYTFLYDLPAAAQSARADERSHVVSAEAGYEVTRRWELGGRYVLKHAAIRTERDGGSWLQSQPNLSVVRARYHLVSRLDAVAEYRWLWNPEVSDQQDGALVALYRNITSSVTLGAGFNATHFSDDLTDLDHDAYGWFVRLLGKY